MPRVQTPRSVPELVKLVARFGKRVLLVPGADVVPQRTATNRVLVYVAYVERLNQIEERRGRVIIGTGVNLGRLSREIKGENGLLKQALSMLANPLVRNRVTLASALDPASAYFDVTTPLVSLEAKVRLQSPKGRRSVSIREFLEAVTAGLKKGELPTSIEFKRLARDERVSFFRVLRAKRKAAVSASACLRLRKNVCVAAEIVVSGSTLIPLRTKKAEKAIMGRPITEFTIKRTATVAADEIMELAESKDAYERSFIEVAVARTLRQIVEAAPVA